MRVLVDYEGTKLLLPQGVSWEQVCAGFKDEPVKAITDRGLVDYVVSRGGSVLEDGGVVSQSGPPERKPK